MKFRGFDLKALNRILGNIEEAEQVLNGIRDEAQEYYDDRSEKWQESEKGEAYQERIDELESVLMAVEDLNSQMQDLAGNLNDE